MHTAGPGRGTANAEPAGVFGVAGGRKGSRFLVPDLDEFQLVLVRSQRLKEAVNTVPWISENRIHAPFNQPFDNQVGNCLCHHLSLFGTSWLGAANGT